MTANYAQIRNGSFLGLLFWAMSGSVAGQNYFLNGSAQAVGDICYQLTAAINTQNGTVWYADPIDLTSPFDLQFTMNFGTNDSNGADGMVFVLQTAGTDAIGESGGGMGFNGFVPSFGVEFDTWQNNKYGDPFVDHIGLVSNGSVNHLTTNSYSTPIQASVVSANIEDGEDHVVRITWEPSTELIEVHFDCELRVSENVNLIDELFNGTSLVTFGFTGSTGGANNVQTVCLQDNIIETGPNVFMCPGGETALSVVGLPGSTFEWSPSAGLDDPTSATPICSADTTTVYTVSYEGYCGGQVTDTVVVTVEELEVNILPEDSPTLTCDVTSFDLAAVSNFSSGVEYAWSTPNGNIVSNAGPFSVANAGGTYVVEASAMGGFCTAVAQIELLTDYSVVELSLPAEGLLLTCAEPELSVAVAADGPAEFIWSGSADFAVVNPDEVEVTGAGLLMVEAVHPVSGCASEAEVMIQSDFTTPLVEAGFADTLTCLSPTALVQGISVSPAGYTPLGTWSWDASTDAAMTPTDVFMPLVAGTGTYYLQVVFAENGCTGSDSLVVSSSVPPPVNIESATLPNVITPNNDNQNDGLALFLDDEPDRNLMALIDAYHLRVYNRWGTSVYENTGLPIRWKGEGADGQPLAAGTYYVVVDFEITCGGVRNGNLQGAVQILREAE